MAPTPDTSAALVAVTSRFRLFEAVGSMLRQAADRGALVVLDDLHRADTDLRGKRAAIVRVHTEAECRHDIPAALATFAEPNYDVVPLGATSNGASAVDELLNTLLGAFPDFRPRRSRSITATTSCSSTPG